MSTSKEKAPVASKTEKAPVAKAKTATAKTATPAKAKTATAKTPKAPVAKKERKSRKGITRTFAAEVTAVVNPVMNAVNSFIANPETSEDALKMIRLELRKAVRATRGTIRTRKTSTK